MADRAVPNLPSRDFAATVEFYAGFGFTESFRDRGWLILQRGPVELEFFPFPDLDPFASSFRCSIRVADLDGLVAEVAAAGVPEATTGIPRLVPVAREAWGGRVGFLIDPDGTQLQLIEDAA